jgi:hypothetical protein
MSYIYTRYYSHSITNYVNTFMETFIILIDSVPSTCDLRQIGGFLRVPRFPPPIILTAKILLKYC